MIAFLIIWNVLGFVFLACGLALRYGRVFDMADGWEFVNPFHIYKYARVNWFGAIVLALIYSAICPVAAIIYWFYKLCTVGRK
jgi:hypothetical protein